MTFQLLSTGSTDVKIETSTVTSQSSPNREEGVYSTFIYKYHRRLESLLKITNRLTSLTNPLPYRDTLTAHLPSIDATDCKMEASLRQKKN
jgi:hypothetical protein